MKKTRQSFFRQFTSPNQTQGISGCRQFQGEDLKYDSGREFFKNKQREWLDQQIEEKRKRQQQEKEQEALYARQTLELNRMRGMLQDKFLQTKSNILADLTKTNQQLDYERKEKKRLEKKAVLEYQKKDVQYMKQRGTKQEFFMNI